VLSSRLRCDHSVLLAPSRLLCKQDAESEIWGDSFHSIVSTVCRIVKVENRVKFGDMVVHSMLLQLSQLIGRRQHCLFSNKFTITPSPAPVAAVRDSLCGLAGVIG